MESSTGDVDKTDWWKCVDCGEPCTIKCAHGPRCEEHLWEHELAEPGCREAFSRAQYILFRMMQQQAALEAEIFPIELQMVALARKHAENLEAGYQRIYSLAGSPYGESDEDFEHWLRDGANVPAELLM